jgi:hypothetical protein
MELQCSQKPQIMKFFSSKYLILIVVIAGVFWMVKDSFTQPGIKDLNGNFTETAFYRNENNTGPIIRIYAVSVSDTLYSEMQDYGNLMPHTKYGTTTVYFFKNTSPVPNTIHANPPHFDQAFAANCIGVYEKNGMSKVSFAKSLR